MTDRVLCFTVVLEQPTRTDDVEPVLEAIRQLRGVATVVPVVADSEYYVAVEHARMDLIRKLYDVLKR